MPTFYRTCRRSLRVSENMTHRTPRSTLRHPRTFMRDRTCQVQYVERFESGHTNSLPPNNSLIGQPHCLSTLAQGAIDETRPASWELLWTAQRGHAPSCDPGFLYLWRNACRRHGMAVIKYSVPSSRFLAGRPNLSKAPDRTFCDTREHHPA